MTNLFLVTSLVSGSVAMASLVGSAEVHATAASDRGYDVICITRTIPGDPQPYEACVYNPLAIV